MNKIVPPFLFNMQDSMKSVLFGTCVLLHHSVYLHSNAESEVNLMKYAEDGMTELVMCAGLAHIDSVILPVLQ